MTSVTVKVKRLTETAKIPTFAHPYDACADIYADTNCKINPGEIQLISTGIAIELQSGFEAQIRPRSGLALKYGLMVVNSPGTIDTGYRGEIKVILLNTGEEIYEVVKGLRLAQMAIRPVPSVEFEEVAEISETVRGDGGFGSTGTH